MKRLVLLMSVWSLFILPFSSLVQAEEVVDKAKTEKEGKECQNKVLKEETSETSHVITINGVEIKYKAYAGTMVLKDDKEDTKASFFYVAYIKEGEESKAERPITFCFNGGPGSSSIWLHMGVFGPKRVRFDDEGVAQPPYRLVENEFCFLDVTDLVFIDPVSTGYSRPAYNEDPKQFHGVDGDVKWVAEFIRLYTTRNSRWDSPKFIAGESYGTTRAASLASYLHNEFFYYLNGVILVSSVLNFQTLDFDSGNDLSFIVFLPSYTATAWYHKKLAPELQNDFKKTLQEAERFALQEYALALMQGDSLEPAKRKEVIKKIAFYTGLSETYIEKANMRVCMSRFSKQLLHDQNRIVGRFDSRFKGIDQDMCADSGNDDPSAEAVLGAFTAAFNTYVRTDLKWEKDAEYKVLANVFPWNYGKMNKYLNVSDALCDVMTKNPALKVFVANGYYDLATPYFATSYTFSHLGLDPSLRNHVSMEYYPAGHMLYTHRASLEKFKNDVSGFIKTTLRK